MGCTNIIIIKRCSLAQSVFTRPNRAGACRGRVNGFGSVRGYSHIKVFVREDYERDSNQGKVSGNHFDGDATSIPGMEKAMIGSLKG